MGIGRRAGDVSELAACLVEQHAAPRPIGRAWPMPGVFALLVASWRTAGEAKNKIRRNAENMRRYAAAFRLVVGGNGFIITLDH